MDWHPHLRQNSIDAIAFGSPSAAFDPADIMTLCGSDSRSGEGPVAMLLGDVSGPGGRCGRPIRLLDWVEKPVDFDRLRRRIEGAELAGFSRTPRILCLGFAGNRAACEPMAPQERGDAASKPVQTAADLGASGRVHLAIIDAAGLSAMEAQSLHSLCQSAEPPAVIIVAEPGMPRAAWDRINASLAGSLLSSRQFAEELQSLLNAKGLKRSLESGHREGKDHEGAPADHLCRG
jgi:hypothetical protein